MRDLKQTKLDQSKRQTLQRLAVGAAFAAPLVTSVSVKGLTISKVHAATAASSSLRADDGKKDHKKKKCRRGEEWDPVKKQCAPKRCEPTEAIVRDGRCEPREPECPGDQVWVPERERCCDRINDFVSCDSGTDQ